MIERKAHVLASDWLRSLNRFTNELSMIIPTSNGTESAVI